MQTAFKAEDGFINGTVSAKKVSEAVGRKY